MLRGVALPAEESSWHIYRIEIRHVGLLAGIEMNVIFSGLRQRKITLGIESLTGVVIEGHAREKCEEGGLATLGS